MEKPLIERWKKNKSMCFRMVANVHCKCTQYTAETLFNMAIGQKIPTNVIESVFKLSKKTSMNIYNVVCQSHIVCLRIIVRIILKYVKRACLNWNNEIAENLRKKKQKVRKWVLLVTLHMRTPEGKKYIQRQYLLNDISIYRCSCNLCSFLCKMIYLNNFYTF